jgi:hypothetical protein
MTTKELSEELMNDAPEDRIISMTLHAFTLERKNQDLKKLVDIAVASLMYLTDESQEEVESKLANLLERKDASNG